MLLFHGPSGVGKTMLVGLCLHLQSAAAAPRMAAFLSCMPHDADGQDPHFRPMQWRTMCTRRYRAWCLLPPPEAHMCAHRAP